MKIFLPTAVALAMSLQGFSQDLPFGVFVSSAGSGQTDQAQLTWTVGEPFVGTLSSPAGSLAQGFFYQATAALVTAVHAPLSAPEIRVFPNPATDRLTITVPTTFATYHVRVLDAVGRERHSETVVGGTEKTVDTSHFTAGAYYLQMRDPGNKSVKIFKILILN